MRKFALPLLFALGAPAALAANPAPYAAVTQQRLEKRCLQFSEHGWPTGERRVRRHDVMRKLRGGQ